MDTGRGMAAIIDALSMQFWVQQGGFSSPHVTNPQNLGFSDQGLRVFHPRGSITYIYILKPGGFLW